jgi:bifunctional non-homologous end joining protein LigD
MILPRQIDHALVPRCIQSPIRNRKRGRLNRPAICFWFPLDRSAKPPGFILPCQPALAERPPSGPGWLHEIKFDGYRVIARKDSERVRLWARTTSDYSNTFTRIRDAVAALPVRERRARWRGDCSAPR